MTGDDGQDREHGQSITEVILPDLVLLAVSLGVQLAMLAVLANRDSLARAWMRLQARASGRRERERHDVAVAQFRREMAAWEHAELGR